jgi:hypothetical protein
MSLKSPTKVLHSQDGYEISVKDGLSLPEDSAALLLAGSDGTDSHYLLLDEEGRKMLAGAGSSGSPSGGILSIQGTGGTGDEIKVMGHIDIDNFPTDLSIVQDNASELLASIGGLGGSGSALVGNPVRLGLKNEGDGTTLDILSDSSGRLLIAGAAFNGDALTGAPVRVGASDGTNAINVLADASGRLINVGAVSAGDAVAGAPLRMGGSDSTDTTDILTDSAGRLLVSGAANNGDAVVGSPVRLGASDSGDITRDILSDNQGRLIIVGAAADDSAPSGSPVLAGGWDGANVQIFKLDNNGALQVSEVKASEATLYETVATTSSASLLASNVAREGAIVFNDSNKFLYVKLGASASTSSFTAKIAPQAQYIVPAGFTGEISGIWNDAAAVGKARTTELAPGAGGGGGGGGGSALSITPYQDGTAQSPVYISEGDMFTMYRPNDNYDGALGSSYNYIMNSTAVNKDWTIYESTPGPTYEILTGMFGPIIVAQGDSSGSYSEPMPADFSLPDFLMRHPGPSGHTDDVWTGNGNTWNVCYFKVTASGITFTLRYLRSIAA